MRIRRFVTTALVSIGLIVGGVSMSSPAQANTTYETADICTSPQNSRYTMLTAAGWERRSSDGWVRLSYMDVYFLKDNAAYNWSSSLTVADKQGSWQGQSWSGNPPTHQFINFAGSPFRSSPVSHYAYSSAYGTPGGQTVRCGDTVYAD